MFDVMATAPAFPTPAPDWPSLKTELLCPLCEYNLRGLTEPRCPECGFTFDWNELLNSELHRHPYLFEHQSKRKVRSFLKTYWRNALPWRFWREVSPVQTVFPRRLFLYWIITNSLALLLLIAPAILTAMDTAKGNAIGRAMWTPNAGGSRYTYSGPTSSYFPPTRNPAFTRNFRISSLSAAQLNATYPPTLSSAFLYQVWQYSTSDGPFGLVLLLLVIWPWLTVLSLLIFQISMRRAKIRQSHVLRCAIYGCDFGFLSMVLLLLLRTEPFRGLLLNPQRIDAQIIVYALPGYAVLATYRLTFAYKLYLRFHFPFFTILASQVIVFLFVMTALAAIFLN